MNKSPLLAVVVMSNSRILYKTTTIKTVLSNNFGQIFIETLLAEI